MGSLCKARLQLWELGLCMLTHTHTTKSMDGYAVEETRLARYIVAFTAVGLCST